MAGEMVTPRWRPTFRRGALVGMVLGAAAATLVTGASPLGELSLQTFAWLVVAGFPLSFLSSMLLIVHPAAAQVGVLLSVPVMWGLWGGGGATIAAMLVDRIREYARGEGPR